MTPRRDGAAGLEGACSSPWFLSLALHTGLALLASGCGGRSAPLTTPASVQPRGYEHALAFNYYMLCESPDGNLRCRGLHPTGQVAEAWAPYTSGVRSIAVANLGVCGVREGRVLCWGEDPTQMGVEDGSEEGELFCSEQTFHGLTGVRELAMGEETGCAITEDGTTRCWGWSLGIENPDDMRVYTVARNAHGLALGADHGCAITDDGVRCWGEPITEDALPPGQTLAVPVPQPVQVVAGESFACARSADGRVFCWGYDIAGTLGMGPDDGEDHTAPRELPNLRAVDLVAGESGVCALTEGGQSYCWGDNHAGQLGLGHTRAVNVPTHVPGLDGAVDVVFGNEALCARFADRRIQCAGDFTPLMSDTEVDVMGPQRLPEGPVSRLLLTERAACVTRASGVTCYGDGGYMRRGQQEAAAGWPLEAQDEQHLTYVSDIDASGRCSRWADGRVRCETTIGEPVELVGTHGIAAAGNNVCVIRQDRKVVCWVRGRAGSVPTEVPTIADAASLALTGSRACVVTTQGALRCWTVVPGMITGPPGPTTDLTDVRSVALHEGRTCVVRGEGDVACWQDSLAVQGSITGVSQLVPRGRDLCALQAGQVRCLRFDGRHMTLGDPVPGVSGVVELATGGDYLCGRIESGGVQCWGRNRRSQLGVVPPMLRLALTEIPDASVEPEVRANFECAPAPEADYDDDGGYDYQDDEGYGDEQGYGEGNDFDHEMHDFESDGPI